jgi:hypothetical protein
MKVIEMTPDVLHTQLGKIGHEEGSEGDVRRDVARKVRKVEQPHFPTGLGLAGWEAWKRRNGETGRRGDGDTGTRGGRQKAEGRGQKAA